MMFVVCALHAAVLRSEFFEKLRRNGMFTVPWIGFAPIELNTKVRATSSARNARVLSLRKPSLAFENMLKC